MTRLHSPARLTLTALALSTIVLAACGSDDDDSDSASTDTPTTLAAAAPATTAGAAATTMAAPDSTSAAAGAVSVELADSSFGKILVDGEGNALYLFTNDTAGKSVCSGDCATNWPALASDTVPTIGSGLDAEDFTTITGADGAKQVAFYGHPLYYFAGDSEPGDTNGQNVGGVWFLVDAEGNTITT